MNLLFKTVSKSEQPQVIALFKAAADKIHRMGVDHWQYWKNPPVEKLKWVEDGINKEEYFFVENPQGETIGMLRLLDEDLMYWGEQTSKAKYVHSLVVIEKYNGKGIGAHILNHVEKQAQNEGCRYLRLDADSKNPKLCHYYEGLGFKKVGAKQLSISTYNLYEKELGN